MAENEFSGSRILLVEDEESLALGLEYNLGEEGYRVELAADGREALRLAQTQSYDLVILDIMLPYVNGFKVAEILRQKDPQLPILMLTARVSSKDRVKGLEMGADDYLTKPFHLQELLLRVRGMLRRKQWYRAEKNVPKVYRFGRNEVDFETLTCRCSGNEIHLTVREALLLKYMVNNKGKIITREELLREVWNISSEVETRTVDNFIARLRKYFEPDLAHPRYIKSVRGAGYMFTDEEGDAPSP